MDFLNYCFFGYWEDISDPRTKDFPLIGCGPLPVLGIIAAYIFFVKVAGPRLMANRAPFELRKTLVVYNVYNVIISVWFFFESIYCLDYGVKLFDFSFPDPNDRSERSMHTCKMLYIYMISKFIDMADTVFFVLRKKNRQIR